MKIDERDESMISLTYVRKKVNSKNNNNKNFYGKIKITQFAMGRLVAYYLKQD